MQTFTGVNGCDSIVTLHLTVSVGIQSWAQSTFQVYPNPTTGKVTVVANNIDQLWVYDIYGKLLLRQNVMGSSTEIDLSTFADGVYLIKIFNHNEFVGTQKIIKE